MLANLCWTPSISVPAGLTSGGLPVGLQITARRHRDEVPLRLARVWEQTQPWPRHAPAA
jgi:aspartyl-tRNA(Asn)/glutamyl-tRNA(Gln) amidotransferase subunit A